MFMRTLIERPLLVKLFPSACKVDRLVTVNEVESKVFKFFKLKASCTTILGPCERVDSRKRRLK